MIGLYIGLFFLLLVIGLLFSPMRLHIRVTDKEKAILADYCFIRFFLYPGTKKKEKKKKNKKNTRTSSGTASKDGGMKKLKSVWPLLEKALPKVPKLISSVCVSRFRLKVSVASENAAETAQDYGLFCSFFGLLWGPVNEIFSIPSPKIDVSCDFDGKQTSYKLDLILKSNLFSLLRMVLPVLWEYFLYVVKTSKGGVHHG